MKYEGIITKDVSTEEEQFVEVQLKDKSTVTCKPSRKMVDAGIILAVGDNVIFLANGGFRTGTIIYRART